jgi:hypothetical protein
MLPATIGKRKLPKKFDRHFSTRDGRIVSHTVATGTST